MPKSPSSGLLLHFHVEVEGGKVLDIQSAMIDVLRWEQQHEGQSFALDTTVTGTLYLAWLAGKRLGLVEGIDQAGWAGQVVDYRVLDKDEAAEDGAAPDPTR